MAEKKQSSTTIGCAWYKVSEGGKEYMPLAINKEILPLTLTEKHALVLFPVAEEDRKGEDSPHYRLVLSLKQKAE